MQTSHTPNWNTCLKQYGTLNIYLISAIQDELWSLLNFIEPANFKSL